MARKATKSKPSSAPGLSAVQLKAIAHPLRYRIQTILDEREASPTELAELLGEDFYRICYHVRKLREAGCIELVDTDNRHGGTQHIYKAVVRPLLETVDAKRLTKQLREAGSASVIPLVIRDLEASIESGVFDSRPARSLLRMSIVVDELGFEETGEAAVEYLKKLSDIESRSTSRLVAEGRDGFKADTATLVFPKGKKRRN